MKKALTFCIAVGIVAAIRLMATPSENNFAAVTNDWRCGNYSNVYELAQIRFAANSNDLVAVNLLVEYDAIFSNVSTLSNSVARLICVSDAIVSPAYSNAYHAVRPAWVYYRDEFLPNYTEAMKSADQQKTNPVGSPMCCDSVLKILWDSGLW